MKTKNKKDKLFFAIFVVSKPFKVFFYWFFLLKNKIWEIQFFERRTYFSKKITYLFAKWRTCYGVTIEDTRV